MLKNTLTKKVNLFSIVLLLIIAFLFYYSIFDIFDQNIPVSKSDDVYYFIEKYNITLQYNNNASNKIIKGLEEYYNIHNLNKDNFGGYVGGTFRNPIIFMLNGRNYHYVLNHETGHIFFELGLSEEERNQYELYYNQTSKFTRYWFWSFLHKKSAEEHFAEAFRCYFEKWRTCYIGLTNGQKTFLKNVIERERNED